MDKLEERVTTLPEIKQVIENVLIKMTGDNELRRVYCLACGGSFACFYPMEYFLKNEAKTFSVSSITSSEFVYKSPKALDANSLIFCMSLTGSTKETINAAKKAKKAGATVVALTGSHNSELANIADYDIVYKIDIDTPSDEQNQFMGLALAIELLNQTEGYPHYDKAIEGLGKIRLISEKAVEKIRPLCEKFGEERKDEPGIYTIASGPSSSVAYMQSICLFMEMEWIHSAAIHSGEYFHGPFEITENQVPFVIFLSDGPTRILDERALDFLHRFSDKVTVIDSKELGINIIDDTVVEYFNPIIHWAAGIAYAQGLATAKKHPLMQRRYMGKLTY